MSKEILNFLSHYTTYEYKGPHEILAGGVTPWIGHVIFADMLIRAYRPQCLVELGSHTGVSFFALCEAVKQSWLKTTCYAVDGHRHCSADCHKWDVPLLPGVLPNCCGNSNWRRGASHAGL